MVWFKGKDMIDELEARLNAASAGLSGAVEHLGELPFPYVVAGNSVSARSTNANSTRYPTHPQARACQYSRGYALLSPCSLPFRCIVGHNRRDGRPVRVRALHGHYRGRLAGKVRRRESSRSLKIVFGQVVSALLEAGANKHHVANNGDTAALLAHFQHRILQLLAAAP